MKKYLLVLVILAMATACRTVVDFDIPLNKPTVVVNSLFTPDSTWKVHVSYSNSILNDDLFGSNFQPVSNAVVSILDPNNLVVETLIGQANKFNRYSYKGQTKPLPGVSYTVQVAIKDEPILRAINKVPTRVSIASVQVDSSRFKTEGEAIEMDITFNDPPDEKNYYNIKIIEDSFYVVNKDTMLITQPLFFKVVEQTLSNNEITSDENGPEKLTNDNFFNGKSRTFHIELFGRRSLSYGSQMIEQHVRVVLLNISEEFYQYFTTKNLQDNTNGDPFAQPVQVFTNVENGLGIFAGYSASVYKLK